MNHNGIGSGFYCPSCPSQEAYVDYSTNDQGILVGFLLTCTSCGTMWVEAQNAS